MKLQAFLLIIALVGTNLDVKYAQEIAYFKLGTKECSTKCKSGYLKVFDSCIFNFDVSFKETLPDLSSLNFELMEDSTNIYNHILTLDMKSDCEGYKENSDVYCTELDINVFRITIKAKELSRYSEANVRIYITTPNKPNIFGDVQKFPRFYDSTDAIGQLSVNGMSIPSEAYCNATIKGNKLNIKFDCISPALPCWIQIEINENIVVRGIENQVVWNETFKSSLALNLSIQFAACRLDGNSNYINCIFQSEFVHSEVDNISKTAIILGVSITVSVILILVVVFMVYWFKFRKQETNKEIDNMPFGNLENETNPFDTTDNLEMELRTNDQEIIKREVDVNSKELKGWTALMFATTRGDKEIVQQLIEAGATVNAQNKEGWTALMLAARHGHVDIFKHLITNGASVNLTEKHGLTALMISTMKGNKEIVRAITETNPATLEKVRGKVGFKDTFKYKRVVTRDRNRKSLIDKESLKIAKETIPLLNHSVIDETSCKENDAAINDEIRGENVRQVPENTKAENKYPESKRVQVLKKGTVIDIINNASKGNIKMLDILICQGVNIDDKTEDGKTALMVLCLKGCTNGVKLVLSKGANIDAVNDKKGLTALMFACHKGDIETVELLIKKGANVNLLDKQGWNALMHAVRNGYKEIAYLLTNGKIKEEAANIDKCPEETRSNDSGCSKDININGNHETCEQLSVPIEQSEEISSENKANDFKLESVSETNGDASDVNA